jgi:poly(3-hydroxybutyrate) depolymerase
VEVSLCTIDGAGHCWPGNAQCPYGSSTTTISANARIFDAFDLQSR